MLITTVQIATQVGFGSLRGCQTAMPSFLQSCHNLNFILCSSVLVLPWLPCPVSYLFEGRADSGSDWVQISQGDLPWKMATTFPRNNVLGRDISSSYTSGDSSLEFTEVSFYKHDYNVCGTPPTQEDYRGTSSYTNNVCTCQS